MVGVLGFLAAALCHTKKNIRITFPRVIFTVEDVLYINMQKNFKIKVKLFLVNIR